MEILDDMWYISPYMEVLMLKTHFSQNLDPQNILPEYPRPNLRRNSYINLNGHWNYLFSESVELPLEYEGKILVPFHQKVQYLVLIGV